MNSNVKNIYRPANTKEKLPLPLPCRYFEVEHEREESPVFANRDEDGRLHCEDGAAIKFGDQALEYWRHGRAHREGGDPAIYIQESTTVKVYLSPAIRGGSPTSLTLLPGSEICCEDGLIHNDKGAAVVYHGDSDFDLVEHWCHGRRHREDGAAVKTPRARIWFYHGLLHRDDGPACISSPLDDEPPAFFWYGRRLAFDGPMDEDFPTSEPHLMLVLQALSYSQTCPDLDDKNVMAMLARTYELMPELRLLASGVGDSGLKVFKKNISDFLKDP